jgi:dGTPase
MLTRQDLENRELLNLVPWGARSAESKGRAHRVQSHPFRTEYQRDRDRIIHSRAFRRLEYKTQVFIPHERDHFRTRLTHTIEVAQISRTLARCLALNEDLAEAIALAHDLGHPPFGHAGEDVLARLLHEVGGFNHNAQCLRVIDLLEDRYADHPGLNLTYEVREGIARHETSSPILHPEFAERLFPTLEASLVDIADEIAYNAHDIDDGIASGLLTFDRIKSSPWWRGLDMEKSGAVAALDSENLRYLIVRRLVDVMATDVLKETNRRIVESGVQSVDDVRHSCGKLAGYSPTVGVIASEIKQFLKAELYQHPQQMAMKQHAAQIVTAIFERLSANPELMPERFRLRLSHEPGHVIVADYLSGMTDRFAESAYTEIIGKK